MSVRYLLFVYIIFVLFVYAASFESLSCFSLFLLKFAVEFNQIL